MEQDELLIIRMVSDDDILVVVMLQMMMMLYEVYLNDYNMIDVDVDKNERNHQTYYNNIYYNVNGMDVNKVKVG